MSHMIQALPYRLRPMNTLWPRLRDHFARLSAAHDARQRHMDVTDGDVADTGLTREVVVGCPSYQPELPFFMQRNFQAHRN